MKDQRLMFLLSPCIPPNLYCAVGTRIPEFLLKWPLCESPLPAFISLRVVKAARSLLSSRGSQPLDVFRECKWNLKMLWVGVFREMRSRPSWYESNGN